VASYPLDIEATGPLRVARWRPLVLWLFALPLEVWAWLLGLGAAVVVFLSWWAVLLTGRMPRSFGDYLTGVLRYQWRLASYLYAFVDRFPGFATPAGDVDPGDFPAVLYCSRAGKQRRLGVLLRGLLALPQFVVVSFVLAAQALVLLVGWFVVLVTGRWPTRMREFAIGAFRWVLRVDAFVWLLTDVYPPFGTAS
jgi:hypothetical protein